MSIEVAVNALRSRLAELAVEKDRVDAALSALNGDVATVTAKTYAGDVATVTAKTYAKSLAAPPEPPATVRERKPRSTGVSESVFNYLKTNGESSTTNIAAALKLDVMQVSQALTAGKKKGKFASAGRGVWALAAAPTESAV